MPAPTSITTGFNASTNQLLINAPAHVEGDVLVCFIRSQVNGGADVVPPSGGSKISTPYDNGASGGRVLGAWAKEATDSEPSSYTFTIGARSTGAIEAFDGNVVEL